MKTLSSIEFFRLLSSVNNMVRLGLITHDEAEAFIAKTGYVKISDMEYHAPDGSIHGISGEK